MVWRRKLTFYRVSAAMVSLPPQMAMPLQEAGFTHVDVSLTDEGILLVPVRDESAGRGALRPVELPAAWGTGNEPT